MTQILSLSLDESTVRGILADVGGGRVDIRKVFESSSPHSLLSADVIANQTWLKETLKQHGISADQVLVTIARDLGLMRRLEIPNVPPAEWPTHVGFQARTKLAQPLDSLIWDFLPLPRDDKGNAVHLTALTKAHLQHLQSVLTGVGLKPQQIHLTPVALMDFLSHGQSSRRMTQIPAAILIHLLDERLEILLFQQGILSATHAARLSDHDHQIPQILSEVTRASLAFQKQLPVGTSPVLLLNAPATLRAELSAALEQRLRQIPESLELPTNIRLADPAVMDALDFPRWIEPLGTLLGQTAGKNHSINLLAPRRPLPQRDYRKRRMVILAVGLIAVIGSGSFLYAKKWTEQSRKISDLKKQEAGYDNFLKRGEPILKSGQAVEAWLGSKIDWLEEVRQFTSHFPSGDRLYLTELQVDPIVGTNTAGHKGTISVRGLAKERNDVIKLEETLIKLPGKYQVLPHKAKLPPTPAPGQPGGERKPYPVEFDLTVHLAMAGLPPTPESKTTDPKPTDSKPEENIPPENKTPETKSPEAGTPAVTAPTDSKSAESKPADQKPPTETPTSEAKPADPTNPPASGTPAAPATPASPAAAEASKPESTSVPANSSEAAPAASSTDSATGGNP